MKKKTPLPAKITVGMATTGIILVTLGMIKESFAISIAGLVLALNGFFASFVVSMVLSIKKMYPSRGDPYQRKMRALSYISLTAGCMSFLSVGIVLYGLYYFDRGAKPIMNLGLALIAGGIVVCIAISVVMAVMSKVSIPSEGAKVAVPSSGIAASQMPYSPDPVISRILANPYVLLDERIRQLHEVQNLLQYPEIQQIFFEPTKVYELFERDRVGELLDIVRDWITRNNADEIFAAAEKRRPGNMPRTVRTDKAARTDPPKKSSSIKTAVFLAIWLTAFALIWFAILFPRMR